MRFTVLISAMGLLVSGSAGVCFAAPIEWAAAEGGNGHFYEFVPASAITWPIARQAAEARMFGGEQGHLATITSQEENNFVAAHLLNYSSGAWLGGWQEVGQSPTAGWHWITGEPWSFTNWHSGEPNDLGEDELYLDMFGHAQPGQRSFWNDASHMRTYWWTSGYIVEYPVPEPGTISLIAIGAGALVRRRAGRSATV